MGNFTAPIIIGIVLLLALFGGIVISATCGLGFTDSLYEAVSALATVGLTTGITPILGLPAKILLIVVNIWIGIPYLMLIATGILMNTPADLYESARIDGANAFQTYMKITLPYMLFVTGPYLLTSFTGNINNFNIIYLLSGGGPTYIGDSAGQTDLLVTWLYKLSIDKQQFNMGAVIGIFTFIVLAVVALVTYRSSGSYKDEEGFK